MPFAQQHSLSKALLVREYEWVMGSVQEGINRVLGLALLQTDGQMEAETDSKIVRQHSHLPKTDKSTEWRKQLHGKTH